MIKVTGSDSPLDPKYYNFERGCANSPCPSYKKNGPYSSPNSIEYKRTTGENIPNYHARKRRGELLPFTTFSQIEKVGAASTWFTIVENPCTNGCNPIAYPSGTGGFISDTKPWWIVPSTPTNLNATESELALLLQNAAARVYTTQGWDALTFLAELKQTFQMFHNFGKSLVTLGKTKPKGRSWTDMWLEWRYGWRTLYYDAQDLVKALNADRSKVRFRAKAELVKTTSSVDTWTDTWLYRYVDCVYQNNWKRVYRASIIADIVPPQFIVNPVLTAYELVPYSFVADWFLDVGTYLEAMSFLVLQSNYAAALGSQTTFTRDGTSTYRSRSGYTGDHESTAYLRVTTTERTPASIPLVPQLTNKLNTEKLVDAMSLLRQLLK